LIACIFIAGDRQTILIAGQATVEQYQALLISTTYENTLSEPTPGNRSISITVFDGSHQGMTAVLVIVVMVNDNPIQLEAALNTSISLVEGGNLTSRIGAVAGLMLSDGDKEEILTHLNVSLSGQLEPTRESISAEIEGEQITSRSSITYEQPGSLSDYEVRCYSKCVLSVPLCVQELSIYVCICDLLNIHIAVINSMTF